ncbi:MAG TPA: type II toxin-antitoxin system RelE/ParE family toxin [Polyangiaceae bacterium]|nr:type II toxin-antitoxin system RelE/ParE family toxin [Polyangiaceae bacterium]
MKLVWSAAAVQQFTQLFEYIAAQGPDAAERIANEIDEAALSLLDFPEMGSPGPRPDILGSAS